jgi:hypothetical protein
LVVAEQDAGILEPGRVVRLRERLWRVDRVEGKIFAATPLDGKEASSQRFHADLEDVYSGRMPYPVANAQ